jgi:rapamycin-insensitive companion of mTOR
VPPHFYGEMTKTDLGCALLQEKGHFGDFASFIRQHGQEDQDAELLLKLKSTLWAVVGLSSCLERLASKSAKGNAGAAEGGLPFLEEEDLIPVIVDIAQTSPVCSVRG